MPNDPETLYLRLGHLIAGMPVVPETGPLRPDVLQWLGQAYALVAQGGDLTDRVEMRNHMSGLNAPGDRDYTMQLVAMILHRNLAVANLKAPTSSRDAFIPAGNAFDAMVAVGKVVSAAHVSLLIVDPYMDEKALTDFAVQARRGTTIRLLADRGQHKPGLRPAAERWQAQHGAARPLEVRLSEHRSLHDRLIIVDREAVWVLTQSLNAFAARSPASIVKTDAETAGLKIEAYDVIWRDAQPFVATQ